MMKAPRIMLAGTHSGVGKTTITTAVMSLLTKAGHRVNPFKVGPDYIDPSYHGLATGRPCRNLDCWMLQPAHVYELFYRTAQKGGINVIEGVMGLFDGASGTSDEGSSAQIAKLTRTPVILIVDAKSAARSVAATVLGFKNFDPALNLAGVILNRVGSERHLALVSEAIEKYCNVPIVGHIKKNASLELPSRHLGLIPTGEGGELTEKVGQLGEVIAEGIDLAGIAAIAENAPELVPPEKDALFPRGLHDTDMGGRVKIGIAQDEAFSFYYQDGLDILEHFGATLVPFSPIHDRKLPAGLQGLYIGGGYPEIYARELSGNQSMLASIRQFGNSGRPVYGECGGFMYMTEGITDGAGEFFPMVGLIPGKTAMRKKLVSLGYVTAICQGENLFGPVGTKLRGHEFHYSDYEGDTCGDGAAFQLIRNRTKEEVPAGYASGQVLASYLHVHFGTNINAAQSFVEKCRAVGCMENDT